MYYDHHVHDGFRVAAIVLGAIAASLPAAIAALNGIMFQSEARRLELRYESMFHALSEHGRIFGFESNASPLALVTMILPDEPGMHRKLCATLQNSPSQKLASGRLCIKCITCGLGNELD